MEEAPISITLSLLVSLQEDTPIGLSPTSHTDPSSCTKASFDSTYLFVPPSHPISLVFRCTFINTYK